MAALGAGRHNNLLGGRNHRREGWVGISDTGLRAMVIAFLLLLKVVKVLEGFKEGNVVAHSWELCTGISANWC